MKTTVIMVRHGFSESNKAETFTGNAETPLTDIGLKQADMAAEYLKKYKIDKIYASDLSRAYNTALPIAKLQNIQIIKNKNLREISAGDWEMMHFDDINKKYEEQFTLWLNDIGRCAPPNGEKVKDFFERIKNEVLKLINENKGKTICLVTHATPIRVAKTFALKKDVSEMNSVNWCPNASISIFEYENGSFDIIADGITEHLKDFVTSLPKNV